MKNMGVRGKEKDLYGRGKSKRKGLKKERNMKKWEKFIAY